MIKKKLVIGLTGGIATGKSSVLLEFRKLGAKTIDCDRLAREAVKNGTPALHKIKNLFGPEVISNNGNLDRAALAQIIFSSSNKKKALEKIIHPVVKNAVRNRLNKIKRGVVVVDVPLLFEAGWQDLFDKTVMVWAPKRTQMERLLKRNSLTRSEALARISSQMPLHKKRLLADVVISNSGDFSHTRAQVRKFYKKRLATMRAARM